MRLRHCYMESIGTGSIRLSELLLFLSSLLVFFQSAFADSERPSTVLTLSVSAVGEEQELLRHQLQGFSSLRPDIRVEWQITPDDGDQRRQLYVQWLNAGIARPDVLQLDVVWTAEFAAANWLAPLNTSSLELDEFFPNVLAANYWQDQLFALPWFVDVGMLYWRTDLLNAPPKSYAELASNAAQLLAEGKVEYGFVWQGARYEGLVCNFLELLAGFGGDTSLASGSFSINSPEAISALAFMRESIVAKIVPAAVLGWHEEETRKFAFQEGRALYMRNWPYAYSLLRNQKNSAVAGKFAISPLPAGPDGKPGGVLGGQQLAINRHSQYQEQAQALIEFLTAPEQMRERAKLLGHLPSRPMIFDEKELRDYLVIPAAEAKRAVETARARPVTPAYAEISDRLQIGLHQALSGQIRAEEAVRSMQREIETIYSRMALKTPSANHSQLHDTFLNWALIVPTLAGLALLLFLLELSRRFRRLTAIDRSNQQLAWCFVAPALFLIICVAIVPLLTTFWESLYQNDLRMPWQGSQFVGLSNYREALSDTRLLYAALHTLSFMIITIPIELITGVVLALGMNATIRGRGPTRAAILLPWAVPAVITGLLWRFLTPPQMLTAVPDAWFPIIAADIWKTSPFVALLVLAGLQGISTDLYDAAKIDGAGVWKRFTQITLPLLTPALAVAALFRSLDALRIFDLPYALTGGGPGTATEPVSLYNHSLLLQHLRFGYGSAVASLLFIGTALFALVYLRILGRHLLPERGQR